MITKQNKKVTKSTLISFLSLPDIWRRHRWFAREMTSEKRAQKFYTGDWLEICLIQSYLGSDASSVWNFCARFSNVISRETTGSVTKCRLFSQATWVSNTNGLEVQLTVHAVTVDMGKAGPADYSKHILRFVGLLSMLCNYFESRLFDHSPKYINASLTGCTGERTWPLAENQRLHLPTYNQKYKYNQLSLWRTTLGPVFLPRGRKTEKRQGPT